MGYNRTVSSAPTYFDGSLSKNFIQNALFNMIISQDIIGGSIKNNYNLVDKARVDGGLLGDTKLYIDVPVEYSVPWTQDGVDETNVLALHRPAAPKTQDLVFGIYRQARITKDAYISKQSFGTEGAFAQYQSILDGRLTKAKEMYDTLTYNAAFGCAEGVKNVEVTLSDINATGVEKTRLEAEVIAQAIADLVSDMKDYSNKYTINGTTGANQEKFVRAFSEDEIKVVWNTKFLNKIRKISLPNIYHNENLIDKFGGDQLPARFFGKVNAEATVGDGVKVRSLVEQFIGNNHYFPGDLIKTTDTAPAKTSYTTDEDVICKVYTGNVMPYMSAFTVGTSFFNGKNLSENMRIVTMKKSLGSKN